MNWAPLCIHTHYSLLRGFCKPDEIVSKCKEYGYKACAITDYKSVSGAVNFYKACQAEGIKPIIGCDFGDFSLLAKNKAGWFDLIELTGTIDTDNFNMTLEKMTQKDNLYRLDASLRKREIYYSQREDAILQRILLCSGMKTTLSKVEKKLEGADRRFFDSDEFYLPSPDDFESMGIDENEIKKVNQVVDLCEEYDILRKPMLPKFVCPDGMEENDYLTELCREGWKRLLIPQGKVKTDETKQAYVDRIKKELDVIFGADLSGYFLIVQDIIRHIESEGWLAGPGRGSAAGCLISYLIGITNVDPIEYNLIFERFYNEGRNTEEYISLPDIDIDVPAEHREEVIDYIKRKYGDANVSQMITFGRLQGRAALKEVLRMHDAVSFAEMNEITKGIPNEADISDQLESMEERSIIKWALLNEGDNLRKWCKINEGALEGSLAPLFEQAIRIEGTNKSMGKHAAGVIISKDRLNSICPMTQDKSGNMIAAFEMGDLESQGHVKFDILGIDLLSKIMEIKE